METNVAKVFEKELAQITNKEFRDRVLDIIELCPNYVLVVPSSSTGKYHPRDEVGCEEGMIRHIQRCVVVTTELVRMHKYGSTSIQRDVLIAGSILHDIFKQGEPTDKILSNGIVGHKGKHTNPIHPRLIYKTIHKYIEKNMFKDLEKPLTTRMGDNLEALADVCLFHEGQWTTDKSREDYTAQTKGVMMTPERKRLCMAMHITDYVTSRRAIADVFQYPKGE